jgi:CDP-diacylglycerol pyrophosphatase
MIRYPLAQERYRFESGPQPSVEVVCLRGETVYKARLHPIQVLMAAFARGSHDAGSVEAV